jgi:orotate phosphoribosyltransferase
VVLVDRQEGGLEAVQAEVASVESIVTVEDLMAHSTVSGELTAPETLL